MVESEFITIDDDQGADMMTIGAALGGLKSTIDLVSKARGMQDNLKIEEAISGLLDRFINVQTACLDLQDSYRMLADEKHELEKQMAELKSQITEKAKYRLHEFSSGALAYVADVSADGEPAHFICATCHESGKKIFLRPSPDRDFMFCQSGNGAHTISTV